jgi:hypothetical protein
LPLLHKNVGVLSIELGEGWDMVLGAGRFRSRLVLARSSYLGMKRRVRGWLPSGEIRLRAAKLGHGDAAVHPVTLRYQTQLGHEKVRT